uniref:Uncharacterized protein n=1 Tax=Scophthalmus maximus TaxID=52904 RepID=A0A8D3BK76_SCOMX
SNEIWALCSQSFRLTFFRSPHIPSFISIFVCLSLNKQMLSLFIAKGIEKIRSFSTLPFAQHTSIIVKVSCEGSSRLKWKYRAFGDGACCKPSNYRMWIHP